MIKCKQLLSKQILLGLTHITSKMQMVQSMNNNRYLSIARRPRNKGANSNKFLMVKLWHLPSQQSKISPVCHGNIYTKICQSQ